MRPTRDANTTGRRISKQIVNSGDWNCTHHYYYDGQRMIETRNGSAQVLKQHVWGLTYVDELVQISVNQDPENASTEENDENLCERPIWVLQDVNFNVIGVVNHSGLLLERYEYTPYGQRTVFSRDYLLCDFDGDGDVDIGDYGCFFGAYIVPPESPLDLDGDGVVEREVGQDDRVIFEADYAAGPSSTDDALVSYPRLESCRGWSSSALIPLATGICDVGHQGLHLDKEFGLYYNRARYHHPRLGRFGQRDPSGYADGMSLYQYVGGNPLVYVDPSGTDRWVTGTIHLEIIYPVYDDKCCIKEYRKCEFYPKARTGTLREFLRNAIGAIVWHVEGEVHCVTTAKSAVRGTKYQTSCEADRRLHELMQRLEKKAPRFGSAHNCRTMVCIWRLCGVRSSKYRAWAKYDRQQAAKYSAWAMHRNKIGDRAAAEWNRKEAKKYRKQAAYNEGVAAEDDKYWAGAAYGDHLTFGPELLAD